MAQTFPSITPSQNGSARTTAAKLSIASFGNGYEQRTPMGRNFKRDRLQLSWEGLTTTERDTILDFLDAMAGGDVTLYQSPFDKTAKLYRTEGEWTVTNMGGAIWTISVTFLQVFQ